jgi:hypothetical protein
VIRALGQSLLVLICVPLFLLMLPFGIWRVYRLHLRGPIRKAIKPYVLMLNAHAFKRSESHLARLSGQRESATDKLRDEHERQVRLRIDREQIGKW